MYWRTDVYSSHSLTFWRRTVASPAQNRQNTRECTFDAHAYRFANKPHDMLRRAAMTKHCECLSVICTGTSCPLLCK